MSGAGFRAATSARLVAVACIIPFPVIGAGIVWVGDTCFGLGFIGLGLLMIALLLDSILVRIRVDDCGISKSSWFAGFSHRWNEVEWWTASSWTEDHERVRAALFKVRCFWWHRWVRDWEAEQPGFDMFLEQVRRHAGDKERA